MSATQTARRGFARRLVEIGMFFQGNDAVHQTMRRVVDFFTRLGIPYAIVGGMAVNAHGHARTTRDIDFLLTADGFERFIAGIANGGFERVAGRPRRFRDPGTDTTFDILVAGLFPGSGAPGPIAFPDPTEVAELRQALWVISLAQLIQLKLAARRYQDFADVVNLIRVHSLDESFLPRLHAAVHADFIECLDEMRREAEYERRQDQAVLDAATKPLGEAPHSAAESQPTVDGT